MNRKSPNLNAYVKMPNKIPQPCTDRPMRLNPVFVERMMGFPAGWSDLTVENMELEDPALMSHKDLWDDEEWRNALTPSLSRKENKIMQNRIKLQGNSLVPQVAVKAFERIIELAKESSGQ